MEGKERAKRGKIDGNVHFIASTSACIFAPHCVIFLCFSTYRFASPFVVLKSIKGIFFFFPFCEQHFSSSVSLCERNERHN